MNAIVIGGLYAASLYMLVRRSIVRLIFGLALISHAAHLLIFTAGGLRRAQPPLIPEGANQLATAPADPLPQALILTAIVINFGVIAFAMVLVHRAYQTVGSDDIDRMQSTER